MVNTPSSKTFYRIDDRPELIEQPLGRMAVSHDPFPGVADDAGFVGFDPNTPAVPDHSSNVIQLLSEIRDILKNPFKPVPFFQEGYITIPPTATGEIIVATPQPFYHFYISKAPRILNIYSNRKGMFLDALAIGEQLHVKYPYPLKAFSIEWVDNGGGQTQQLGYIVSTEEIKVEKGGT